MRMKIQNEEERLRNTLSIRFNDFEHRSITELAWTTRVSASELIRQIILEKLKAKVRQN